MARHDKSIWECKVSAILTLREDTNLIIVEAAKEMGLSKGKALDAMLQQSPEFHRKRKELEEKGFFI